MKKAYWTNQLKEGLIAIPVGVILSLSVVDYHQWKAEAPTVVEYTDIGDIGLPIPTGNTNIWDLIPNHQWLGSNQYKYTLDVVIEAEDEYWEIEKLGGNYYRIRREDYDDMEGHYEFFTEEELGTLEDVYDYIKHHKVPKQYR